MAQSFDHRAGEYRTRRRLVRTITRQNFSLSHDPRFHVIHGVELILGYPFERCKTMQSDDQNDGSPVNDQNNCSLVMNNTIQYDQIPSLTLIQKDTKLWSERWFFCERSEWCFFVNNQNDDSIVKHQNNGSIVNNQIHGSIVNDGYIVNHQRLLSCYTIWTDSPTVMIQTGNSLGSCIHRYYPLYGERWLYCEPSEGWFFCERSLVKRYEHFPWLWWMIGTCIQRYYPLYGSLVNDGYIVNHQKDGSIVNDLLLNDMAVMIETDNSLGTCIHRYYPLYGKQYG